MARKEWPCRTSTQDLGDLPVSHALIRRADMQCQRRYERRARRIRDEGDQSRYRD